MLMNEVYFACTCTHCTLRDCINIVCIPSIGSKCWSFDRFTRDVTKVTYPIHLQSLNIKTRRWMNPSIWFISKIMLTTCRCSYATDTTTVFLADWCGRIAEYLDRYTSCSTQPDAGIYASYPAQPRPPSSIQRCSSVVKYKVSIQIRVWSINTPGLDREQQYSGDTAPTCSQVRDCPAMVSADQR